MNAVFRSMKWCGAGAVLVVGLLFSAPRSAVAAPDGLSPADSEQIGNELKQLDEQLRGLRDKVSAQELADAVIFSKGVAWALRYEPKLEPADVALVKQALARGRARAAELAGKASWTTRKGRLVRGYRSGLDASVQPFGVIVPAGYDPQKPIRLDVVLHGSMRPVGMSELRFMERFDKEDDPAAAPDQPFIEVHPLGRVENCYRWAGEEDVFEVIGAACRDYNIDRRRIVLRGMSMGASGTWHLGLKHPDRFVALGPYCGYVDTHKFSLTPLPNFVKIGALPDHQERGLHMLDSVDYAANAGVVPAIACMGEKDIFFDAHVIMGEAMKNEGLEMVNLISPGTGHVIDPVTHKEQMRRIAEYADAGLDSGRRKLRFVTWTLKYSRCHWVQLLGLGEHYSRAEINAEASADGSVEVAEPSNVTRFAIGPPMLQSALARLRVGGQDVALPADRDPKQEERPVVIGRRDGRWAYLGGLAEMSLPGKQPGVQGPIDDAFTSPFICVRGTGKPWNEAVARWSDANLARFAYEWNRYLRGDVKVKNDVDITDEDLRNANIILFGDPGSNSLIAQSLNKLPIEWTPQQLRIGGTQYSAADHAPALICPSPFPNAEGRYVVLNSGHTFHEYEFATINYLLFPRLGDWAVLKVGGKIPDKPSEPLEEEVLHAGFCDEEWRIPTISAATK